MPIHTPLSPRDAAVDQSQPTWPAGQGPSSARVALLTPSTDAANQRWDADRAPDVDALHSATAAALPADVLHALRDRLKLSSALRVEPLLRPALSDDQSYKFKVYDSRGRAVAFLDWGSPVSPQAPRHACQRASGFARAVGPALARPIVVPEPLGDFGPRACTIAPLAYELTTTPGVRALERRRLGLQLAAWLQRMALATARKATPQEVEAMYARPLHAMAINRETTPHVRQIARQGLRALHSGQWKPTVQAAHYDLRSTNILQRRAHWGAAPVLIDWGGARLVGHAFYDLICLAESMGLPMTLVRMAVKRMASDQDVDVHTIGAHVVATLGFLRLTQPMWSDALFHRSMYTASDYCHQLGLTWPLQDMVPKLGSRASMIDTIWHTSSVMPSGYE